MARAMVDTTLGRLIDRQQPGVTVFLCHRFDVTESIDPGEPSETIVAMLEWLRRNRIDLVSVRRVVDWCRGGDAPARRAVAFTLDDGYVDQGSIASEVFERFDCPATIFLTTGFLDRTVVPWWDVVTNVFESTARDRIELGFAGHVRIYPAASPQERLWSSHRVQELAKTLTDDDRLGLIETLATSAGVEALQVPTAPYEPMTWSTARQLERGGLVEFGPHTVTHPMLASVDDDRSETEMRTSWARLVDELAAPIPVFAYPNGEANDFGDREVGIARDMGMVGAVTVASERITGPAVDPYRIPRVPMPRHRVSASAWARGGPYARRLASV